VRKLTSRVLGSVIALATAAAISTVIATPAHAASIYLNGESTTGNAGIAGNYVYNLDGYAAGRPKYDGYFYGITLYDHQDGNSRGAALVLSYDEWENGSWRHVDPYIARRGVDGPNGYWSYNDKANIRISICDYYSDMTFRYCSQLV
jgi:hypothetical protein